MKDDLESGQRLMKVTALLTASFLKVQGGQGEIAANCWVLASTRNSANIYICPPLNAHQSPVSSMGLRQNLLLIVPSGIETLTLKSWFQNRFAMLPLREWIK